MWMMGYNEGAQDSLTTNRKLRPLIPRLSSCHTTESSAANTTSDHRFNMVATMAVDQNKREIMMMNSEIQHHHHPPVVVSSRWNPTLDQLRVLEDLYRQGTRTPSAEQIQQITSQLKRYGKIEGKNVFYWFQNHKARERQKRRRQMETEQQQHQEQHNQEELAITTTNLVPNHGFEKKDSSDYKVEQTKNWICSVGCDTQPEKVHDEEEPVSITMVAAAANRWVEQERRNINATWHMMNLPPGLYPSPHHHNHNIILNSASTVLSNISTTNVSSAKDTVTVSQALETNTEIGQRHGHSQRDHQEQHEDCSNGEIDDDHHEDHTLELFPLKKEGFCSNGGDCEKEKESGIHCFYEFLPLKN